MSRLGRHFTVHLAAIAAAGVALRVVYLLTIGRSVTGIGDWWFYHWQANAIADGLGFVEPFRLEFDHVRLPSAGHPPLYPLLLSAVSLVGGDSVMAHRALGVPLGAVTIVLVGLLGRRAGGDRVGLVAAAICAAYPLMVATDAALMSETLYGALIAATLLAACAAARPARRLDRARDRRGDRARGAHPFGGAAARAAARLAGLRRRRAGMAHARGRRHGRLRAGHRAVDDPQRGRLRAPGADLQQRRHGDRRRQLRPHLPRREHGRLGHPLHL